MKGISMNNYPFHCSRWNKVRSGIRSRLNIPWWTIILFAHCNNGRIHQHQIHTCSPAGKTSAVPNGSCTHGHSSSSTYTAHSGSYASSIRPKHTQVTRLSIGLRVASENRFGQYCHRCDDRFPSELQDDLLQWDDPFS